MPQSLSNLLIHIVFSTKNRTPFIEPVIEKEFHLYMLGICKKHGVSLIKIGGVEDHIHLLVDLPRTITVSKLVQEVKVGSSKWLKTKGSQFLHFAWQSGYAVFSVSSTHKDALIQYIDNQRQHHLNSSFQDEYRSLLHKNHLELDERYAWD